MVGDKIGSDWVAVVGSCCEVSSALSPTSSPTSSDKESYNHHKDHRVIIIMNIAIHG